MLLITYATTLFVAAALMFAVQPMFGKMVLPLLGGSAAAWNTEVAFCQGTLLLGYLYAHLTARWLGVRPQALLQCLLILLPFIVLPISVAGDWSPPTGERPVMWLFLVLTVALGLPFFVVATISPMVQKWFSTTAHSQAQDPYFLYAASNAGSLLGLLGYPVLIEPYFQLEFQSWIWVGGYALLVVLMYACALRVWFSGSPTDSAAAVETSVAAPAIEVLAVARRTRWVALAFVPSSLMLSVTTYLSTNITPLPLLWVVPLGLYLITMILVFSRTKLLPDELVARVYPITMVALVSVIIFSATRPIWLMFPIHLIAFFVTAMRCHGELAHDRPTTVHLTEYYLWISLGGVLGGMFNALLAPVLFSSLLEYPLVLVAGALVLGWVRPGTEAGYNWRDFVFPAALGVVVTVLVLATNILQWALLAAIVCYGFSRRPLRFGLGLTGLLLAGSLYFGVQADLLHVERNFFGVHRVFVDREGPFHFLSHSGTLHGKQSLDPARRCEPLAYYHPTGPLGQFFNVFYEESEQWIVGAVGLGAGSIVSYSRPGQKWTFFEIDPAVVRIARDPRFFAFLTECGSGARMVLGDARLSLARESELFDLLILDAYSSDSIPVHLMTREALQLYLEKISPGGWLLFHISNHFLDLRPVLGDLAEDAGVACLVLDDSALSAQQRALGKEPSLWAVITRDREGLDKLTRHGNWKPLSSSGAATWTDSYSSVLSLLNWSG